MAFQACEKFDKPGRFTSETHPNLDLQWTRSSPIVVIAAAVVMVALVFVGCSCSQMTGDTTVGRSLAIIGALVTTTIARTKVIHCASFVRSVSLTMTTFCVT